MKYLNALLISISMSASVVASDIVEHGTHTNKIESESIAKAIMTANGEGMLGVVIPPHRITLACHYLSDMVSAYDYYEDSTIRKYASVVVKLKQDRKCSTIRVPSVAIKVIDSRIAVLAKEIRYVHIYEMLTANKETMYTMFSSITKLARM